MRCRVGEGKRAEEPRGAQVRELGGACTELRLWMKSGHLLFLILFVDLATPPESVSQIPILKLGS